MHFFFKSPYISVINVTVILIIDRKSNNYDSKLEFFTFIFWTSIDSIDGHFRPISNGSLGYVPQGQFKNS